MVKTIGILCLAAVVVFLELPQLLKNKLMKELVVFTILLIIGITLSILLAFGVKLPNPVDLLIFLLKPLTNFIES